MSGAMYVNYKKSHFKCIAISMGLVVATFIIFLVGITLSQGQMTFTEAYSYLFDYITASDKSAYMEYLKETDPYGAYPKTEEMINTSVPRLIRGISVGVTLAICGTIMQSVVKNPLADPFTTGISSGALLGVSLFIAMGITVLPFATGNFAIISNAFLFSLIPTAMIMFFSIFKKNITPSMMILIGIAVMYIFSAFSSLLRYKADPDSAQVIFTWTLGHLGTSNGIDQGTIILVFTAIAAVVIGFTIPHLLNVMTTGDKVSTSLGVNVKMFRIICLVIVALLAALCVSFSGTIGFVGLVCPHIARLIVGANNKFVVPCSGLIGAFMLTLSDCIAKVIMHGLPVGAVTALIGSPIFIYLLVKQKKDVW